jgi:hypothetical protein
MGFGAFDGHQRFACRRWIDEKKSHTGLLITDSQILQIVFEKLPIRPWVFSATKFSKSIWLTPDNTILIADRAVYLGAFRHRALDLADSNFLTLIMPYDNFSKDNNNLKIIPSQENIPLPNW